MSFYKRKPMSNVYIIDTTCTMLQVQMSQVKENTTYLYLVKISMHFELYVFNKAVCKSFRLFSFIYFHKYHYYHYEIYHIQYTIYKVKNMVMALMKYVIVRGRGIHE